jgi:hypothetical protein
VSDETHDADAPDAAPALLGGDSVVTDEGSDGAAVAGGRRIGIVVAVAVVAIVVAAVGTFVLAGSGDDELTGTAAADAFVEAYTRSLDATFLVEGELTRTLSDGRTLSSAYLVAQRPPDRIQRSLGSTSGELGGRTVNCSTPPGGEYTCAASGETTSWEEQRATTLGALDSYVRGDDPVYSVTVDDQGCFVLERVRPEVEATFGGGARLCFDERYGAVRRLEVEREGGATDVMLAVVITDEVTDADFDVQGDATYDPEVPDDSGTVPPPTSQEPPP